MHTTLLYIIIGFLVFDYILERVLDYLNASKRNSPIPEELAGIYDAAQYEKQQNYEKETGRFSFITSTFSLALILLMFAFGGFALLDNYIRAEITTQPILLALCFFGILLFISDILNTPFSIYSTFVIEEKYGFNKTTVKTFIFDKVKSWLIGALIGGGLLSAIIWLITLYNTTFWIWAWLLVGGFMIFMAMFYSNLIVPLFNKQTPLEDGTLKDAIQAFSQKAGFTLSNIFVIDGSKRSTKANAYFTGLGSKKRIVLFDTLKNELTDNEIVAVLAHEIGHYKHKHTLSMIFISLFQTGVMFYILGRFINEPSLSLALGSENHSIHLALIAFGMLYSPLSFVIGMFINILSRKNEYQADLYAKNNFGAEHLISALKKLSEKNLSNLTPHPIYVFFHYSHPPLLQRIRNMQGKKD